MAILVAGVATAQAFDPLKTFRSDDEPRTVLRYGFNALKQGDMAAALGAFKYGAERNDVAAEWKLARMFQAGAGGEKDDYAAYQLFAKIADRFVEKFPARGDKAYVSNAVVTLGLYSLRGIKGSPVRKNYRRAEDHFYRAAALYQDAEAQYQLGTLYRSGALGVKQTVGAARWFGLASRKGHAKAQVELGEMLFNGEGVSRKPVRGLVLMTKALANSARGGISSIREKRREAFRRASKRNRLAAVKIIRSLNLSNQFTSDSPIESFSPSVGAVRAAQAD